MFSKWGYLSKNLLSVKHSENHSCCLYLGGDYLLLRQNESVLSHFPVQGDVSKPGGLWKNQSRVIRQENGTWSPIYVIVNLEKQSGLVEKLCAVAESGFWLSGKRRYSVLGGSPEFHQESSLKATTKNRRCCLAPLRVSPEPIEILGKFPIDVSVPWILKQ